jgi:hypothetical protein
MNTHTVRRHVVTLALRQQITKDDRLSITSHRARIFVTGPCSPVSFKPPASAGGEADDQPEGFA